MSWKRKKVLIQCDTTDLQFLNLEIFICDVDRITVMLYLHQQSLGEQVKTSG